MVIGKDYEKNPRALEGAALFYLSLEQSGAVKIGGAPHIVKATFRDLGVTEDEVVDYIREHGDALRQKLAERHAR